MKKSKLLKVADKMKKGLDQAAKDVKRDKYYTRTYGISLYTYNKMLNDQKGVCWICGKPNKTVRLAVDHRHVKGFKKMDSYAKSEEVRGLLCIYCNRLIGRVEHSKSCRPILENIIKYFAKFKMKGD